MNRVLRSILPLLPVVATLSATAQAPPAAAQNSVVETSRIARFLAGPGDRPQGVLLRNGTLVTFTPGLAQQLPATIAKGTAVRVAGDELTYNGSKTVEARTITVAGTSYQDVPSSTPPVPPPTPAQPGPRAAAAPPPPPPPPPSPCGPVAPPLPPPPPPAAGAPDTPLPAPPTPQP
jgi:hypothetical protein